MPLMHQLVDLIVLRQLCIGSVRQLRLRRHRDARDIDQSHVAGDHHALATLCSHGDQPMLIHLRHLLVLGQELRERRHILRAAIGKLGHDLQCLFGRLRV